MRLSRARSLRQQPFFSGRGGVRVEVMQPPIFLQAALNGDRTHPAAPRTPTAIAEAARAAVDAGAHSVHVHAFDDAGRESLEGGACARVLRAVRALCPDTPVSLTTSAAIVRDPGTRFRLVEAWEELPHLVTANQGEAGIVELCELLLSRGVGLEAGLLTTEDARAFVRSGLADRCRRVLIEPLDLDPAVAVEHAARMEEIVVSAGITLEQVHHGYGIACWAVNRRGLERGHGIRTGLEDVTLLPDGTEARDNAALVTAAAQLIRAQLRSGVRATPT
jgi:uncharacterized protein (DUF849 family)